MSIIFNFLVATFFNGKKSEINFNIFSSVYNFFFLGGGASLMAQTLKNPSIMWRPRFNALVGKILWRRAWLPTPVFWPGEFHEQRSLAGYRPPGHKECDMTERLSLSEKFLAVK